MNKAHVVMDNGQEADIVVREFTVDDRFGGEPKVTIIGSLTRLNKWEPQAPKLEVVNVIYNDPATVVYWSDKTRTVVKCQPGDTYDPKTGFLLALCKKVCGNTGIYNDLLKECIPGYENECPKVEEMRKELADYCHDRICSECTLGYTGFECGRGKFFTVSEGDAGYMTDKSIIKHYRAMKKGELANGHK